ncbi:MAG TPA: hypothetical protein VGQ24_03805, partial [Gemmatimonadales bacterium]|nr:hypothetical protein [Gemmatimonadales bacterium]
AGADLTHAHLSKTVVARSHDLHHALGLDSLEYFSPSAIDLETLRHCIAGLCDDFLAGTGVEASELEAVRALCSAKILTTG